MVIAINVKFHGTFYPVVKTDSVQLELENGATVSDAFAALERRFGKDFAEHTKRLDYLIIFVNDTEYRQLQGLKTVLSEGDKLTLGHVIAGG